MSETINIAMKCSQNGADFLALFEKRGNHYSYLENQVVKTHSGQKQSSHQPKSSKFDSSYRSSSKQILPSMKRLQENGQRHQSDNQSNSSSSVKSPQNVQTNISPESVVWVGFSCICGHSATPDFNHDFIQCGSCRNLVCTAKSYTTKNGAEVFVCTDSCGAASGIGEGSIETLSASKKVQDPSTDQDRKRISSAQDKLPSPIELTRKLFQLSKK